MGKYWGQQYDVQTKLVRTVICFMNMYTIYPKDWFFDLISFCFFCLWMNFKEYFAL